MIGSIVRVLITLAVPEPLRAFVVRVAKMFWNRQRAAGFDILQRRVDRAIRRVALVGGGDVDGRLRQGNARFRPAHKLCGLMRRDGQDEGHRVRQPHILRRANHDPPRNKSRVFPRMNHLGEPVERRVGIAAPHRFDECGNSVVMRVAISVIDDGLFLNALLGGGEVDEDRSVRAPRRGQGSDLQRVQSLARVAIGHPGDVAQRFFRGFSLHVSQASLPIAQRPAQQTKQILLPERPQLENLRARNQRGIDKEKGIVKFSWSPESLTFAEIISKTGATPLPPYLKREVEASDRERYQTVYSKNEGAVAAPTAGLHFTNNVFASLKSKNIETDFLTLHVSAGTFQPVKVENALDHIMHAEQIVISKSTIENLLEGNRKTIAVGTTSLRTLESLYWYGVMLQANPDAEFIINQDRPYLKDQIEMEFSQAIEKVYAKMERDQVNELIGETSIYIIPGYTFKSCEALITNFHQPGSTLMLLVAAFVGTDWKEIYEQALQENYRFLSFGDSSLLFRLS